MRRAVRGAVAAAGAAAVTPLLASCAAPATDVTLTCRNIDALILEAQSVPAATRLPCVELLPAGWSYGPSDIRSGRSRFWLASDRAGARAVEVSLSERCDRRGATEIASDEPGTRRYERVEAVTPGFRGTRYYTFPGGCASYLFRFEDEGRVLVNEASLALTFVTRQFVADEVRRISKGRSRL